MKTEKAQEWIFLSFFSLHIVHVAGGRHKLNVTIQPPSKRIPFLGVFVNDM